MQCHIVGAGGVGGFFGGLIARSGVDVTFVERGEQYRALRDQGLTVNSVRANFQIAQPSVVQSISADERPDLILVFVKTYHTATVAQELAKATRPDTTIITFQTGLENDLEILEHVSTQRVFPGVAYVNSSRTAPGIIEQISGPCTLTFGTRGGTNDPMLRDVEAMLRAATIDATFSSEIERVMWTKLIWICAFAGMTTLFRSKAGPIVNDVDGNRLFHRCLDEAYAIAAARDIHFSPEERDSVVQKIAYYKKEGRNAKTSMLLDVEGGRRTEIATMHGTLVKYARQEGLDVPLLEAINAVVQVHDHNIGGSH